MAQKFHIGWVTRTGAMIVEEAATYADEKAAAQDSVSEAFDGVNPVPVYLKTVDGTHVVIYNPDHFVVLTEDDVAKMMGAQQLVMEEQDSDGN